MPPLMDDRASGRQYWRSLDHLADTAEFREFMFREFPAGASELLDSADRRHFLKIMGASMALAGLGLSGCRRWPEEHIVPFAARADGYVPGRAEHFASTLRLGGVAQPVLVTAYDGRPTKIEGNPEHPAVRGAATGWSQAAILDLYDPDRSREVRRDGASSTWADFEAFASSHFGGLKSSGGAGLAVLCAAHDGPTMQRLRRRFRQVFPQAKWFEYEPVLNDHRVAGSTQAFGKAYRAHHRLGSTRVIVSLDADFLSTPHDMLANIRGFAESRRLRAGDEMSRFYAVEGALTVTGANADERAALRPSQVRHAAAYLAGRVLDDAALADLGAALPAEVRDLLDHAADDLKAHRGAGAVIAGNGQPAEVHVLVHHLNAHLGNAGKTVVYTPEVPDAETIGIEVPLHLRDVRALAGEIVAGRVSTLLVLGANPVYDAPADLDFGALLPKAGTTIHLGDHLDETGSRCTWHLNRAHPLESWDDGRAWDGMYTVGQPLIEPLWGGRSDIEVLSLVVDGAAAPGQALVRATFDAARGGADDKAWRTALHDGFVRESAQPVSTPAVTRAGIDAAIASIRGAAAADGWDLVFAADASTYDGRFANNGWLQELPDPITKLTWDNAVLVSPAMARELGATDGDLVTVTAGDRSIEAPILRVPGMADRTAVLPLGYGRAYEGRICGGAGFDFGRLRTTDGMTVRGGGGLARASGSYPLATTQDHHAIDVETVGGQGQQQRLPTLFREADLNEYREHPDFAKHRTHVVHRLSLWDDSDLLEGSQYRWAMSIDLNSCVGCNACVVACQSENNIPIVGKDQVKRGREMHWIRIDRYYRFGGDHGHRDPDRMTAVMMQPVVCMQCENAPCEQVCPVAATVHDKDGLNAMVYNRCIGTRYCSNNCPYKVRRFNYFDYHRRDPLREQDTPLQVQPDYYLRRQATPNELKRLQFNPEVTVRMRGVMEKCTYCVQRITEARIKAKNAFVGEDAETKKATERVAIPDGTILPACAQTCPAEAIVFGDLNDPRSRVAQLHANPRSYEMLEELNVKARTRYLAKVRNPRGGGSAGGGGHGHGGAEAKGH